MAIHDNYNICYVCKKPIKTKKYCYIGKNFNGIELYRHMKCKPYTLSSKEIKIRKYWTKNPETIIQKDKRKMSRQVQKINLKKELS